MKNKGQNLMEFGIILALVSFAGIIVLTAMGGNIKAMFTTSHNKYKEYKPFEWGGGPSSGSVNPDDGQQIVVNPDVITPDPVDSIDDVFDSTGSTGTADNEVNGVPVTINGDGSASFKIKGQDVTIPAKAMKDLNTIFGTAGSAGLSTEVMAAIQKLIADHQSEYPGGDVPINLDFGTGIRQGGTGDDGTYTGNATYNQVSVSVGSHKFIIQNDQTKINGDDNMLGIHSIEVINNKGTISSTVSAIDGDTINFPNGEIGAWNGVTTTTRYNWTFNFPGNNVSI